MIPAPQCDLTAERLLELAHLLRVNLRLGEEARHIRPTFPPLLRLLRQHPGLSQRDLVQESHFRKSSISQVLQSLEDDGLVQRKSDPADARVLRVWLTPAGEEMADALEENMRALDTRLLAGLDETQRALLGEMLVQMRSCLLEQGRNHEETEHF